MWYFLHMKTITERWAEAKAAYVAALSQALDCVKDASEKYKSACGQDLPPYYLCDSPWFIDGKLPFNTRAPEASEHYAGSLKTIQRETAFYATVTPEQCMLWIQRWEDKRD